ERLAVGTDGGVRVFYFVEVEIADLGEQLDLLGLGGGVQQRLFRFDDRLWLILAKLHLREQRGAVRGIELEGAAEPTLGALGIAELLITNAELVIELDLFRWWQVLVMVLEDHVEREQRARIVATVEQHLRLSAL